MPMTARQIVATAVLILWCAISAVPQATRSNPSTPEERARAVQVTKKLEQSPLGPEAAQDRQWVTSWIIAIPDITVPVCDELLKPILQGQLGQYRYARELVAQGLAASAVYMIQHPQKNAEDQDEYAINKASMESVLNTYESIVRSGAKGAQWAPLQELLNKRKAGKLDEYIRQATLKCLSGDGETAMLSAFHPGVQPW
jgi:hypothetical protein